MPDITEERENDFREFHEKFSSQKVILGTWPVKFILKFYHIHRYSFLVFEFQHNKRKIKLKIIKKNKLYLAIL